MTKAGELLLNALQGVYRSQATVAKAKIQVYLDNPVGVGDHSTLTETIHEHIRAIAEAEDNLRVVEEYYGIKK